MNSKSMQKRRAIRGANLTETTIVLGIIGILLGGIWAMIGDMRNSVKQQKFAELLTTVVDNIRGNYTGKAFFESTIVTTIMPTLTGMNVFPGNDVKQIGGVSVVVSSFGEVAANPVPGAGATPHRSFYVCGWRSVPTAAQRHCDFGAGAANVPFFAIEFLADRPSCIQAVMRNSSPVTQPGLVAVHVNGSAALAMPVPLAGVGGAANVCLVGTNYIDFVYRLTP